MKLKGIIVTTVRFVLGRLLNYVYRLKKLDERKVVFLSDVRDVLGGNLKSIYDAIKDNENYDIIFEFKADRREKRNFKGKIQLIKTLSTAKYILLDDYSRSINIIKPRKGQEIVQLWHGPGAFKKFGYSRPGQEKYKKVPMVGHKNYTKAIVTADSIRWCFAEGFNMKIENVAASGFPRTDSFFDEEYKKKIKEEIYKDHPSLKNKKVIMFAPTYRQESTALADYDFSKLDLDKIYNELKDEYIFVIKWHPAVYNNMQRGIVPKLDLEKYNGFYIDLSANRDINDLLFVTDVLITDYSSVIFDYALVNKPIVYYTYDLEEYESGRGMYFEFKDYVYGAVAMNVDELISSIKTADMKQELRKEFNEKFMSACDGNSTKKTVELIFGKQE